MKANGLTEKSPQVNQFFGFTNTETVKLDLDNMSFSRVKYWSFKALKQFRLGGFLILKSSENCHHVVFDRAVSWTVHVGIVAWV